MLFVFIHDYISQLKVLFVDRLIVFYFSALREPAVSGAAQQERRKQLRHAQRERG